MLHFTPAFVWRGSRPEITAESWLYVILQKVNSTTLRYAFLTLEVQSNDSMPSFFFLIFLQREAHLLQGHCKLKRVYGSVSISLQQNPPPRSFSFMQTSSFLFPSILLLSSTSSPKHIRLECHDLEENLKERGAFLAHLLWPPNERSICDLPRLSGSPVHQRPYSPFNWLISDL